MKYIYTFQSTLDVGTLESCKLQSRTLINKLNILREHSCSSCTEEYLEQIQIDILQLEKRIEDLTRRTPPKQRQQPQQKGGLSEKRGFLSAKEMIDRFNRRTAIRNKVKIDNEQKINIISESYEMQIRDLESQLLLREERVRHLEQELQSREFQHYEMEHDLNLLEKIVENRFVNVHLPQKLRNQLKNSQMVNLFDHFQQISNELAAFKSKVRQNNQLRVETLDLKASQKSLHTSLSPLRTHSITYERSPNSNQRDQVPLKILDRTKLSAQNQTPK